MQHASAATVSALSILRLLLTTATASPISTPYPRPANSSITSTGASAPQPTGGHLCPMFIEPGHACTQAWLRDCPCAMGGTPLRAKMASTAAVPRTTLATLTLAITSSSSSAGSGSSESRERLTVVDGVTKSLSPVPTPVLSTASDYKPVIRPTPSGNGRAGIGHAGGP